MLSERDRHMCSSKCLIFIWIVYLYHKLKFINLNVFSPRGPHLVVNVLVGDHLVLVACHCLWCQSSAIEIGPLQSTRINFFPLLRRLPCRRSVRILLVVVIGSVATNVSKYQYIYLHHAFTYLILWLALEVDITRALIGIILSYMSTGRFKGLQKQCQTVI